MGKTPCCSKEEVNRGAWSFQEDQILINYIRTHGPGKWRCLPKKAGLNRCGKSCRLRWLNYLRPGIKRGDISKDEEDLIVRLHTLLGNRWSLIAGRLPGRTDNEVKNYWNTNLAKRASYRKLPSKLARKRSETLVKNVEEHDQVVLDNNDDGQPIGTTAIRCNATKLSIINHDQGSHDDHLISVNDASLVSNEGMNDNDRNAPGSSATQASDPTTAHGHHPWIMAHAPDHGQCSRSNGLSTRTSMPEPEEDHDPLGFLIDLDVGNVDIVFGQLHTDTPNPDTDHHFLRAEDDHQAFNKKDADYDTLKSVHLSPPSEPLMDANGTETKMEDKVHEKHEIECEPKMEHNVMLELKKVASFLDLEDDWNEM